MMEEPFTRADYFRFDKLCELTKKIVEEERIVTVRPATININVGANGKGGISVIVMPDGTPRDHHIVYVAEPKYHDLGLELKNLYEKETGEAFSFTKDYKETPPDRPRPKLHLVE